MQTIKLNIVSSIVTHNVYYTMHITYNLIGHEDMHNQKLQCTMHCNHLMFMQESNDKIPNENFCWQVFVWKQRTSDECLCGEWRRSGKSASKGNPFDNACVFWQESLHP